MFEAIVVTSVLLNLLFTFVIFMILGDIESNLCNQQQQWRQQHDHDHDHDNRTTYSNGSNTTSDSYLPAFN